MRIAYVMAVTGLLAASPAMSQVIIQTPNPDADRHEQRAAQDRAEAHWNRQEAQRRAAMGDYRGAAEADRDARQNWHDARRQVQRAQDETGGIVIGR